MKTTTSRDEQIEDQFQGFVLDEEKVLRRVPFAQFLTKTGALGVGLLLPYDRADDKGNITQEWRPVIVTSARIFSPVFQGENRALGIRFESIPAEMPLRYSLVASKRWSKNMDAALDPRALYEDIKAAYQEFLYFRKEWYAVHACWDLATYFFMLFPAFPYLELRGMRGAAKTKVMALSSCLTFNASPILTSPSEASLFRTVHDQRPTLYLDECENLFRVVKGKVETDGRVEVINSGYTSDGYVPRVERVGSKFITQVYHTYCPKMLASIAGLHGATENRAILHVMTRALDNDPRGEKEIDRNDPRWKALRDQLFRFMLTDWERIKAAYDAIGAENISGLKKRELQLWRPLLAVARILGPDVEKELLGVAGRQQELNRAEDISEGSWEYLLLERAYQLVKGGQRVLYLAELAEAIPSEERPHNNKALARILDGLGFRDFERIKDPLSRRLGYVIPSLDVLENIICTIAPLLLSSDSSDSSEYLGEEVLSDATISEEPRRNPPVIGGNIPEESEEKKESKDVSDMKGLLEPFLSNAENGKIYPLEAVAGLCDLTPEEAQAELKQAAARGVVFEPRPEFWGVTRP